MFFDAAAAPDEDVAWDSQASTANLLEQFRQVRAEQLALLAELPTKGYTGVARSSADEAFRLLETEDFDVVVRADQSKRAVATEYNVHENITLSGSLESRQDDENTEGKSNPAGMTPITVCASSFSMSVLPTMVGSRPKRRSQSPSLNSTTRSAPGLSSSARMCRPVAGVTPSIGKRFHVMAEPVSTCVHDTLELRPSHNARLVTKL